MQPQGAIERLTARVQERVNRINQSLEQLLNTLLRRDATRSEASPVTAPSKLQELAQEVKSATASLLRTLKLDKLFSRKEQKTAEPKVDRPERQRVPNEKVEQKRETKPLTTTAKGPGSQVKEQKKVPVVKNPALTAAVKKAVTNGTLRNGAAMNAAVKNALRTGARPNNALKAASNTLIKGAERRLIKKIEIRIKLLSKKMRSPAVRKKQEKLKALAERQKKLFRHLQALHQRNLEKELRKELKKRREKEILENRRAVDLVLGNGHHPEKAELTYDDVAEVDPLEVEIDLN